jgi:hypothetical protein
MACEEAVTAHGGAGSAARLESVWRQILAHLDQERRRIAAEITTYPSPIAGCDAQFAALLEQREQIVEERRTCDKLLRRGVAVFAARIDVDDFLGGSTFVPCELAQRLRSVLGEMADPKNEVRAGTE